MNGQEEKKTLEVTHGSANINKSAEDLAADLEEK